MTTNPASIMSQPLPSVDQPTSCFAPPTGSWLTLATTSAIGSARTSTLHQEYPSTTSIQCSPQSANSSPSYQGSTSQTSPKPISRYYSSSCSKPLYTDNTPPTPQQTLPPTPLMILSITCPMQSAMKLTHPCSPNLAPTALISIPFSPTLYPLGCPANHQHHSEFQPPQPPTTQLQRQIPLLTSQPINSGAYPTGDATAYSYPTTPRLLPCLMPMQLILSSFCY